MDKNKEHSKSNDTRFKELDAKSKFITGDKKEVVAQPVWDKDKDGDSLLGGAFLSLVGLLLPGIHDLRKFGKDEAKERIEEILKPNEQIEWLDEFECKTLADGIRDAVIFVGIITVLALAAPFIAGYFGVSAEEIQKSINNSMFLGPIFIAIFLLILVLVQIGSRKDFIALTNHRIIICGAGKESWICTIYSEDIRSLEIVEKFGKRVIRILLTRHRPTYNHIDAFYLNKIRDVELVVDRLQTYKDTVKTAPEDRFDKPEKFTASTLKSKSKSGVYQFFKIEPGIEISLGLLGLAVSGFLYFGNHTALSWPTIEAVYQSSKVTSKFGIKEKFHIERLFKYKVSDTNYDFKEAVDKEIYSKKEAEIIASEKPIENLTIHYDPKNPSDSKLNPKERLKDSIILALYCVALAITGLIVKTFLPEAKWKELLIHYMILATTLFMAYQIGTYIKF